MRETTIDVKISDAELQKLHEVIDLGLRSGPLDLRAATLALIYSAHTPSQVADWLELVAREIRDGLRVCSEPGPVEVAP